MCCAEPHSGTSPGLHIVARAGVGVAHANTGRLRTQHNTARPTRQQCTRGDIATHTHTRRGRTGYVHRRVCGTRLPATPHTMCKTCARCNTTRLATVAMSDVTPTTPRIVIHACMPGHCLSIATLTHTHMQTHTGSNTCSASLVCAHKHASGGASNGAHGARGTAS